jgi:glycosyltransferase involved in cell wall biosynthesis
VTAPTGRHPREGGDPDPRKSAPTGRHPREGGDPDPRKSAPTGERAKRLAIFNLKAGLGGNVFGKDVANFTLFQALTRHGGFDALDFLMAPPAPPEEVAAALLEPGDRQPAIRTGGMLATNFAVESGAVLRGGAHLDALAWQRRRTAGDSAYSLIGLIHTLAPPAIREEIGELAIAPLQPWDALICTSPSVRDATSRMFDEWEDHVAARYGGRRPPRLQLPIIPLGVDQAAMRARTERPDIRAATRARLGMGDDDILLLWVGRLSFFEKAFPQPMLRAAEMAARETGVPIHFAMVGWFPDPALHEPMYRAAAAAHAPSIGFHIVDGTDADRRDALWAAGDIFVSLVDNVQETFGLTPIEAMAGGLPVVVSDWDGYRYTVADGEDGFLIPSLIGPPGVLSEELIGGHAFNAYTYQQYAGIIAQHTAIDIPRAAQAIAELARSPELRRRMGEAGRRHVAERFDWPVVARQYAALVGELGAIRATARPSPTAHHPLRGDPFRDFAGFATTILDPGRRLHALPDAEAILADSAKVQLDTFAGGWRATMAEIEQMLAILQSGGSTTAGELLAGAPVARHRRLVLSLLWMAKLGMIGWSR